MCADQPRMTGRGEWVDLWMHGVGNTVVKDNKNLGLCLQKNFSGRTAVLRNICNASLSPPLQIIRILEKELKKTKMHKTANLILDFTKKSPATNSRFDLNSFSRLRRGLRFLLWRKNMSEIFAGLKWNQFGGKVDSKKEEWKSERMHNTSCRYS